MTGIKNPPGLTKAARPANGPSAWTAGCLPPMPVWGRYPRERETIKRRRENSNAPLRPNQLMMTHFAVWRTPTIIWANHRKQKKRIAGRANCVLIIGLVIIGWGSFINARHASRKPPGCLAKWWHLLLTASL